MHVAVCLLLLIYFIVLLFFLKTFADTKSHFTFVPYVWNEMTGFFLFFLKCCCYFSYMFVDVCVRRNVRLKIAQGEICWHTCFGKMTERFEETLQIKGSRTGRSSVKDTIKVFNGELRICLLFWVDSSNIYINCEYLMMPTVDQGRARLYRWDGNLGLEGFTAEPQCVTCQRRHK